MFHLEVVEGDENWTTTTYLGPSGQSRQLDRVSFKSRAVQSTLNLDFLAKHLLQGKLTGDAEAVAEKILHLKKLKD